VNELQFFVAASALFFAIGVYGILSKKSAVRILFAVEIIINAASLNIVAFARFTPYNLGEAQSVAIFIIALAAAEAAAGLALIIEAFRLRGKVDVNEMDELKG
jgi:NADH:ubiquinone oxidoreductase subunit K